ncbi:MAG: glucose-fructose oxidoreductase [Acidobacteria bacterium]|nr:MAG: glucose-fructose oxidoreductase [Acidobacteriota bacterium]
MSDSKPQEVTRRGFIAKIGKGLLAANVAGTLIKKAAAQLVVPEPPGRKLGWAIVGLGSLSINQILPAFAKCEKSKVVAFVSGHPDKASKLALRYGVDPKNIYNYQNYDSIKDNPEVDIIYIVLPNGMHAEYTVRGLQSGKHVLSEKPMANTPAECQQMIDAARKAHRKLMVAYRCRYEPYNQEAIRMAHSQELGPTQVILADAGFNIGDPNQWRLKKDLAGGGSLMDIGIYALNASRYLSGEEPVQANAMMYNSPGDPRFKEVEEHVNFQLRFPSGVLANCTSSYGYFPQSHYRVVGTKGWIEMDPATWYSGLRMRVHRGNSIEERELPQRDHFAAEMDHMSDCVIEDREPLTPGEEGLRDIKIITAIYEAARTGKTVELSESNHGRVSSRGNRGWFQDSPCSPYTLHHEGIREKEQKCLTRLEKTAA